MSDRTEPLGPGLRLAYAAPALALALIGIPIYVSVPKFYTDVVGVPIAAVGTVLAAVRLFDAVIDPPIGWLSDRTRTRFGRRRPWMALGAIPLAACLVALLVPPETTPALATLWLAGSIFSLFLFWTAVTVPYEALGPELTQDYHERTRLLGLRDGLLLVGTVLAVTAPAWIDALRPAAPGPAGERARFAAIATLYAPILVGLCALCALVVREPSPRSPAPAAAPPGAGLRTLLANRPFRILLASYTVSALGSNLPATLILYYVQYVLGAPSAEPFLLLYFAVGIAFLPLWIALARRVGKKPAWIASMGLNTAAFAGVAALGAGDTTAYAVLVALSGVGLGGTLAIPSAMQADVIDYDELLSGRRREGQFIGIWSVSRKLAAAAGVGGALAVLGAAGYEPNREQPPAVVATIRVLYAVVPSLCSAAGLLLALSYPIDQRRHREILAAIDARRAGAPAVVDPLGGGTVAGAWS